MLWCILHHYGLQMAHHGTPSRAHPWAFLLEHKADFAYNHNSPSRKWKCDLIPFWMFCFISLANPSRRLANQISFWSSVSPTYTTLSWCFRLSASGTMFSFPGLCWMSTLKKANVSCHLTCFDDNFGWVAKYFKVTLSSTPPHLWSLCNGPKSWDNVSWPTFPFHVLATFALSHLTSCFQMPLTFHFALGLPQWQSQKHRSGSQNLCQSRVILT